MFICNNIETEDIHNYEIPSFGKPEIYLPNVRNYVSSLVNQYHNLFKITPGTKH